MSTSGRKEHDISGVEARPIENPDRRWVIYWAEVLSQRRQGKSVGDARRIAWERAFGKEK